MSVSTKSLSLVAILTLTLGGCIFGVDTEKERNLPDVGGGDGFVTATDGGADVDGARVGDGMADTRRQCPPDAGDCFCQYEQTSDGVCSRGIPGADDTCEAPPSYESDETSCDGLDNDCDGVSDEDCKCAYLDRTVGVCKDQMIDKESNKCATPERFEMEETTCDGLDNDCDGVADEGCPCNFNQKSVGVCANGLRNGNGSCQRPQSYQPEESDCDARDNDCDGSVDELCSCNAGEQGDCYTGPVGTEGVGVCEKGTRMCKSDGTWEMGCNNETTPDANESCDSKDNDCDGTTDEGCPCEYDGKSSGVCASGMLDSKGDCQKPNDYSSDESTCDSKDNDCDGTTDEGCDCNYKMTSKGVCANGTVDSNGNCDKPSDWESDESTCDKKDNDCDGTTDEGCRCDYDGKSTGVCKNGTIGGSGNCKAPSSYSSDESGECDAKDNDCDGKVDEGCSCNPGTSESCYTGPQGTEGVGVCSSGSRTCQSDGTWGSCSDTTSSTESCDGKDNDCDGKTDENLDKQCSLQSGVCSGSTKSCTSGSYPSSCDSSNYGSDYEDPETSCDGKDNDCDGKTDENLTKQCSKQDGVCSGSSRSCQSGTYPTCTSSDYGSEYEDPETSCDGKDNDCDGDVDEGCDDDGDGYCDASMNTSGTPSVCPSGGGDCDDGDSNTNPGASERCDDQSDNDCDGDIDCSDSDCGGNRCGSGSGAVCNGGTCTETECADGNDNDLDGSSDCGDSDCNTEECDGTGTQCQSGDTVCHETACADGNDNDGDGNTDCQDSDCPGCPSGTMCTSSGRCAESNCENGNDDDADGNTDCGDTDCHGDQCNGSGTACKGNKTCGERACFDGNDNDGDGNPDCQDGDCQCPRGTTCLKSGRCAEDNCQNNTDDDLDGKIDCQDSDCDNKRCNGSIAGACCSPSSSMCSTAVSCL